MVNKPETGALCWTDLTVPDADELRDFYAAVVGWQPQACEMGGYSDYTMHAPGSGKAAVGVCHARGVNARIPPQWLIYIAVEDLDSSVAACTERGGKVIVPTRGSEGQDRYCVIEDPAGAIAALIQSA